MVTIHPLFPGHGSEAGSPEMLPRIQLFSHHSFCGYLSVSYDLLAPSVLFFFLENQDLVTIGKYAATTHRRYSLHPCDVQLEGRRAPSYGIGNTIGCNAMPYLWCGFYTEV